MPERIHRTHDSEPHKEKGSERTRLTVALAVSAALHIGGVFHKEIFQEAVDAPRTVRTALSSTERDRALQDVLEQIGSDLDSEKPLSVDLSEFYLQQEELAGGVSQEQIGTAREYYGAILEQVMKQKEEGGTEDDVLGTILKHQGTYEENRSFLTDLLNGRGGNCEARQKLISSLLQDVYPDLVASGKAKVQIFGSYKDVETGEVRQGHVRVVLDQEDGKLAIVEGKNVQYVDASTQANIPTHEVTQLAVKSILAREDLYDFESKDVVHSSDGPAPSLKDERFRAPTLTESLTFLGGNSISAFPRSDAVYATSSGSGYDGFAYAAGVGGAEAQESERMTIYFLKEINKEDPAEIRTESKEGDFEYPLYLYDNVDADDIHNIVVDARSLLDDANSTLSIVVNGSQIPSLDDLKTIGNTDRLNLVIKGLFNAEDWQGLELPHLTISDLTNIPAGLETLQWQEKAELRLEFEKETKFVNLYDLQTHAREPILDVQVSKVTFVTLSSNLLNPSLTLYESSYREFYFHGVLPASLAYAQLQTVALSKENSEIPSGYFRGSNIDSLNLVTYINVARNRNTEGDVLPNDLWGYDESMIDTETSVKKLTVSSDRIAGGAFKGANIEIADLQVSRVFPGALDGATIKELTISGHARGLGDALTRDTTTNIGLVRIPFSVQATRTKEHLLELSTFIGALTDRQTPYAIILKGQGVEGTKMTIEEFKERYGPTAVE